MTRADVLARLLGSSLVVAAAFLPAGGTETLRPLALLHEHMAQDDLIG